MTISLTPTSYFSTPAPELDEKLFEGRHLRSWVRQGVNSLLKGFFDKRFRHSETWAHPWLAGSGVSYQWEAAREPGDLDCLVGVDYVQFRKANPEYRGLTDKEISEMINEEFRDDLHPETEEWNGFELTFYVNPGATDIRTIKPYAAYDLKHDEWTVMPDPNQTAPSNPEWDKVAESDAQTAHQASTRFVQALQDVKISHNGPARRNAEARLAAASQQGIALYDEIHLNRSQAFSPTGEGYDDFYNYRWQAGKRSGAIQALRHIKNYAKETGKSLESSTYGVELPDANTLIRRAATYRAK